MKLFKISRPEDNPHSYDEYDSAIVAADTEAEAREIHPAGSTLKWGSYHAGTWIDTKTVIIEYVGEAKDGTPSGVILASFNAG